MAITLAQLAELVGGSLHGDAALEITGAATIRDARKGEITLADRADLAKPLAESRASAVIVARDYVPTGIAFVAVDDVHQAFVKVVEHFCPPRPVVNHGISPAAFISSSASIGDGVDIAPGVTIGEDVVIGPGTRIAAGVHLLAGSKIGSNVQIFPGAVLYENTVVGDRCLIHANAVLGAFGFGYDTVDGKHQLSAQLGYVVLEDDVEIGACSTIDRGTYGPTVIGQGTKIDNQVMIAHNCRIGRHNIICSQVGVAGSTTTGGYVVMAGQVGLRDHVHIGDQAVLAAKAGVMTDVPAGECFAGIPATPMKHQKLVQASLAKLPEMRKEFKQFKKQLAAVETPTPTIKAA